MVDTRPTTMFVMSDLSPNLETLRESEPDAEIAVRGESDHEGNESWTVTITTKAEDLPVEIVATGSDPEQVAARAWGMLVRLRQESS